MKIGLAYHSLGRVPTPVESLNGLHEFSTCGNSIKVVLFIIYTLASRSNTPWWEVSLFSFSAESQVEDWKTFNIHAINFLEALDIDIGTTDETKKRWKQLKMIFKGVDQRALQTLVDNETAASEAQQIPKSVLEVIQTTIK